ncbi:hypothetical protein BV898_17704 [Hypsibius exemplaris]|uniref:RING-type domain-containing protein n=1 Tax=Hypsibius exemplaris TaxID=2072580 RepID=A0A9X6RMP3_HYPEX|nr:hypothetical protein BV898_17704 [Hypsibius exemplaris]
MAKKWMKMFASLGGSTDPPSRSGSIPSSSSTSFSELPSPVRPSTSQPILTPSSRATSSSNNAHTRRRDAQLAYLSSLPATTDSPSSPSSSLPNHPTNNETIPYSAPASLRPLSTDSSSSATDDTEPSSSYASFTFDLMPHSSHNRRQSEISVQTDGELHQGLSPAEVDYLREECQRAVTDAEDAMKCIICLQKARDTLFSPCHHLVVCEGCSRLLPLHAGISGSYRSCPLCRKSITKVTKVFLS